MSCTYTYNGVEYTYTEIIDKMIEEIIGEDNSILPSREVVDFIIEKGKSEEWTPDKTPNYDNNISAEITDEFAKSYWIFGEERPLYTGYVDKDYFNTFRRQQIEKWIEDNKPDSKNESFDEKKNIVENNPTAKKWVQDRVDEQTRKVHWSGRFSTTVKKIIRSSYAYLNPGQTPNFAHWTSVYVDKENATNPDLIHITEDDKIDIVKALEKMHQDLKSRFKGATFITNTKFTADVTVPATSVIHNSKITATPDMLVVDQEGNTHIIMFASSMTQYLERDQARDLRNTHMLTLERQVLAANGLNVNRTQLYTYEFKLNKDPRRFNNEVSIHPINYENSLILQSNHLTNWRSSHPKAYSNLWQNVVEVEIPKIKTNKSKIEQVRTNLLRLIPNYDIRTQMRTISKENFLKEKVKPSTKEGFKWQFYSIEKGEMVYIKETTDKSNNQELSDAVDKELLELERRHTGEVLNIKEALSEFLAGGEQSLNEILASFYPTSPNAKRRVRNHEIRDFLTSIFSKYWDNGWTIIDNDNFTELGIIALYNTRTKIMDFISLSYYDLNNEKGIEFPSRKGTSILGQFMSDSQLPNSFIMSSRYGNVDIMKTLFAINEFASDYKDFTIGSVRSINPIDGYSTQVPQKMMSNTFVQVCKTLGIENNLNVEEMSFQDQYQQVKSEFIMMKLKGRLYTDPDWFERLTKEDRPPHNAEVIQRLKEMLDVMIKSYAILKENTDVIAANKNLPEVRLYQRIIEALINFQDSNFGEFLVLSQFRLLSTNAANVNDPNTRYIMNESNDKLFNIRDRCLQFRQRITPLFEELKKAKGYTRFKENTIGNEFQIFENMIYRDENNQIHPDMLFVNPYDSKSYLNDAERKFLKTYLFELNKYNFPRWGVEFKSENDPELINYINSEDGEKYFWLPLAKASKTSQIAQFRIKNWLNNTFETLKTPLKSLDEWFKSFSEYDKKRKMSEEDWKVGNQMADSMHYRERARMLKEKGPEYWEMNLETLLLTQDFMYTKQEEFGEAAENMKAYTAYLQITGSDMGLNLEKNMEFIKKRFKNDVQAQSVLDPSLQPLAKISSSFRQFASFLFLGFNPKGFIRDLTQGIWNSTTKARSKLGFSFDQSHLAKAYGYMIGDVKDFVKEITLIEELNVFTGMANMDVHRIVDELKSNKNGLFNFKSRYMFWFARSPDYFNRMTLFIAQAIKDGVWDALSLKDGQLDYDWTKDARFKNLAEGKKGKAYDSELALFNSLVRIFNEENHWGQLEYFQEGKENKLPFPYTKQQIFAMKNSADQLYGYFDFETRSLAEKSFIGSIALQFMTMLTGPLDKWNRKPGWYKNSKLIQEIDSKTGLPIWFDEEGNPTIVKEGNEHRPMMTQGQAYSEGIAYTLAHLFRVATGMVDGILKEEIWNDEVKMKNLREFSNDLSKWLIMLLLTYFLFRPMEKDLYKLAKENPGGIEKFKFGSWKLFTRALSQSTDTLLLPELLTVSIADPEPASYGALSSAIRNMKYMFNGDVAKYWIKTTGAGQSIFGWALPDLDLKSEARRKEKNK